MLLKNEWVNNEVKEEIKEFLEKKWKWTHNSLKLMGHSKGSPEREVHRDIGLPKKNRNISNNQPNPTATRTGGTTNKAQSE